MLEKIDLSQKLDQADYDKKLVRLQNTLHLLAYKVYSQKRPVMIVFEGWDAAGKGGAIKRLTERIDPRGFVVWPIAAPQGDDKVRHYLYRFWRRCPEAGKLAIFDRSYTSCFRLHTFLRMRSFFSSSLIYPILPTGLLYSAFVPFLKNRQYSNYVL